MQKPSDRLKRKIERENLWLFIFSFLRKGKKSGTELRTLIQKRFGFLAGTVTAYKVLYLLESSGYVRSEKTGKSVLYSLTKKGLKELTQSKKILKSYLLKL